MRLIRLNAAKHFLFVVLTLAGVSACTNRNENPDNSTQAASGTTGSAAAGTTGSQFRIHGTLDANAAAGTKLVVQRAEHQRFVPVDSVTTAANGTFEYKGRAAGDQVLMLNSNDKYLLLVIDPQTKDIRVKPGAAGTGDFDIEGSPKSLTAKHFFDELTRRGARLTQLQQSLSGNLTDAQMQQQYQVYMTEVQHAKAYIANFVDTVSSPALAVFVMNTALHPRDDYETIITLTRNLQKRFPNSDLVAQFNKTLQPQKPQENNPNAPKQLYAEGTVLPDISAPSPDGKAIALSSLRGKYVLVDFWASWCGPCRHENPNVVAAYNKYKDKGFTVYNYSLDEKKDRWVKAISDDKLAWNYHVSDLKGWNSQAVSVYGISSIPTNYLIDKEGKVIGFNLRGPALEAALAQHIR